MTSSKQTNLATAAGQNNNLTDDFTFGFDIKDNDESEFLAELAIYGIGHENDIRHFVNLSLMRGVEEWDQAISCATAMKDHATFDHPLDGQDILSFLAKVYGVDLEPLTANAGGPVQKASQPFAKKRPSRLWLQNAPKKLRKVKKGTDSPYWATAPAPLRQEKTEPGDELTAGQRETRASVGSRSPSEILDTGTEPNGGTAIQGQIYEEHELDMSNLLAHRSGRMEVVSPPPDNGGCESESVYGKATKVSTEYPNSMPESDADSEGPEPDTPLRTLEGPHTSIAISEGDDDEELKPRTVDAQDDDESKKLLPLPPPAPKTTQTPKRKATSRYFVEARTTPRPSPSKPKPKPNPKSTPNRRPPRGTVSSLPFPPLDAPNFGLIQEELATDPFRLLIAVTFLIRTSGKAAIPVFRDLMARYPSPEALAAAEADDIVATISHLGLGAVRAATIQRYARLWIENPPQRGVRHAVKNYPLSSGGCNDADDDGRGVFISPEELWDKKREEGEEEGEGEDKADVARTTDNTSSSNGNIIIPIPTSSSSSKTKATAATTKTTTKTTEWEIGHMTQGPYALDSWRIFCRDIFRGVSGDWKGTTASSSTSNLHDNNEAHPAPQYWDGDANEPKEKENEKVFQPEWMRVQPRDKELRACLRWMWMQEGWLWDPITGDKAVLPDDLRRAVQAGRVGYDDTGNLKIMHDHDHDSGKGEDGVEQAKRDDGLARG